MLPLLLAAAALAGDTWTSPRDGVELLERTTGTQRVHAAFVDLCESGVQARATTYDERGRTTSSWANQVGAFVAVNGAFFNYSGYEAIGVSVGDGEVWPTATDYTDFTSAAFATYGRAAIFDPSVDLPRPFEDWWTEMVPGRPLLVDDGVVLHEDCFSHMCQRHPRTAVGLTADAQTAILVTVDGRSPGAAGMTRLELAALMKDLGAHRALNLDGGGSTTMVVDGAVVNDPSDGSQRVVSSHLGFVEGEVTPCCRYEEVPGATGSFGDVADTHWARGYIEAVYAAGITSGCQQSPPLFCPDCVADRKELGVLVARAMGLAPVAASTFTDVPPGAWYAGYVEALRQAGVTSGCASDRFCPDRLATRWEAAAFVKRAMNLPDATPTGRFGDLSDAEARVVEALADACVVDGCTSDAYCPDDIVTRAQIAKLIAVGMSVGPYEACIDEPGDPGDTGEPVDTDPPDGDTDDPEDTDPPDVDTGTSPVDTGHGGGGRRLDSGDDTFGRMSCGGCASGGGPGGLALVVAGLLLTRRRR